MNVRSPSSGDQFKAATREQWDKAAQGWNEQTPQIRAWLADATASMLDLADVRSGSRVLDVAAGAGDQTLDIARRVGPSGSVLATDMSPGILAFAQENARRAGLTNVDSKVADSENLGLDAGGFDAAVCRLGLMLCPDPLRALREIHHAVRPDGRFCTIVFSEPRANPCIGIVVATALEHAGLPPPDPGAPGGLLSLGRPGLIDEFFRTAGFADVRTTRRSAVFRLPTAGDYLKFIRTSAGPILQILSKLDDSAREAAWAEIEEKLKIFQHPAGWEGPNELLLTVGSR
jgi:SAM-dependent methyltransferase